MKHLLLISYAVGALYLSGCSKAAEANSEPPATENENHACHREMKLSEPKYFFGTMCPKEFVSQGHGVNPKGQVVSSCVKYVHECKCEG